MINSYKKGKVKELEAKDLLSTLTGQEWVRLGGRERDRVTLTGDIVAKNTNSWWRQFSLEVKARKTLSIPDWFSKAKDDSNGKPTIMMVWDSKYKRWLFVGDEQLIRRLAILAGYEQGNQQ